MTKITFETHIIETEEREIYHVKQINSYITEKLG